MSIHAHLWQVWGILTGKVGHTDLVFGLGPEFISSSVHAILYKSLCGAVMICAING